MFFGDYHLHKDAKLRKSLFWEYDIERIDWRRMREVVVQRVIERGRIDDFYAILNMYSLQGVIEAIKNISYMNKKDLAFVCSVFQINREDLLCCSSKQLTNPHWNS